jgi:hypothetical protein
MDSNDYTFVEGHDQEQWTIRLKTGDFKDTYYQYGKVKITEPCDNSDPKINFTYQVLESTYDIGGLNGNEKFLYHIGDVLKHILEDSLLNDRNNDTQEPDK